ncbi:MAG: class II SORL domain-containing protein [Candidatus Omnitrophota bacterium]
MATAKDMLQSADWKLEKHMPVIEAQDLARKAEAINISVSVGKEIPHPNTTEHHIAWIAAYFLPKGEKFTYLLARSELSCHGASTLGPNTSTIYTQPSVTLNFKSEKSGTIIAISQCNIHGLWEASREITVE